MGRSQQDEKAMDARTEAAARAGQGLNLTVQDAAPRGMDPMDAEERRAWLAWALCPWVERRSVYRLVAAFGRAASAWAAAEDDWQRRAGLRPQTVARLAGWRKRAAAIDPMSWLAAQGVHAVWMGDADYPRSLLDLPDPPPVLFVRGRHELLRHTHPVAVVGTRRASGYGVEAATWIGEEIACAGGLVVSGMAVGIDIAAHRAALRVQGPTMAVMACGLDRCYPVVHEKDMMEIADNGVLVSEYPPGVMVDKHRFLERNRLLAALAKAVVIVQAGEKSGALRTADMALELGREVYVVPGPITSIHFRGSHRLLYAGASVLVDPRDLLQDLGLAPRERSSARPLPPARWLDLYDALAEPRTAASLAQWLQMPIGHVFTGLLELELGGWIERVPGGSFRRCR